MTMLQLLKLFRSRLALIAAVFTASLLFGALVFFPQQKNYEVSMLVQNLNWAGYSSVNTPLTIRQTIETGVLDKEVAKRVGLTDQKSLPKFQAGDVDRAPAIKIFAFVPAEEIERTKTTLNVLVDVLNEGSRRADAGRIRVPNIPRVPGIRLVSPPAASNFPAGPSNTQVLLAFGLLGLFAGLAAALWSAEREADRLSKLLQ